MSIWLIITIIAIILIVPFGIWLYKTDGLLALSGTVILAFTIIVCGTIAIMCPLKVKKEMIRQNKERQQILYQIENITSESDRVKLNEWILTYNDWVNDVNTSKEMYGWFSWYRTVDMSNHTIIELV